MCAQSPARCRGVHVSAPSGEMHCEGDSCLDLTQPFTHDTLQWLLREHIVSLVVIAAYVIIKLMLRLIGRLVLGTAKCSTTADVSARVWDPACLLHNVVSIAVGMYTVVTWDGGGHHRRLLLKPAAAATADTCIGLSKPQAFTILLQAAHCLSDFVVFLPQMLGDPVIFFHHAVLLVVSLILPHCPGCYFVVAAFGVAELGSASIAVDAEWRRRGGSSRGLKRVLIFGSSRVINLAFLYRIWQVTPFEHEFAVTDVTDGSLIFKANVPICFLATVVGSAMMLGVNGLTWWRMWIAYRKLKKARQAYYQTRKSS